MDSRAETEGLRTENQSLRNVVQQTNQKLNALISIQMEASDRVGDSVRMRTEVVSSVYVACLQTHCGYVYPANTMLECGFSRTASPQTSEELRALRGKTAALEAEIQRLKLPPNATLKPLPVAEVPVEVDGLQAEDEDEHSTLTGIV